MKVRIKDSKDFKVFQRVKDDSSGKAVKTLLRMILGKVNDSSDKTGEVRLTLWNQNMKPESINNILRGSYTEKDLKSDLSELPWGKQLSNFFSSSKNINYDWKLIKFTNNMLQISSEDRDGNIRTLQIERIGKVKDSKGTPERNLLRMFLGKKVKDSTFDDLKGFILDEWDGSLVKKKVSLTDEEIEEVRKLINKHLEDGEHLDLSYKDGVLTMEISK